MRTEIIKKTFPTNEKYTLILIIDNFHKRHISILNKVQLSQNTDLKFSFAFLYKKRNTKYIRTNLLSLKFNIKSEKNSEIETVLNQTIR